MINNHVPNSCLGNGKHNETDKSCFRIEEIESNFESGDFVAFVVVVLSFSSPIQKKNETTLLV